MNGKRVWLGLLAGLLLAAPAISQRLDWRSQIDHVVQRADSLSLLSQQTFHINKFTRNDRSIRETWHYTLEGSRVLLFEVHYFVDSVEYIEVYYLDKDQVVCMEHYKILYPQQEEDRIIWGEVGFFQGQSRRQFVTMGQPPPQEGTRDEWQALNRFRNRYKELLAQRGLQEKDRKEPIFGP